MKKLLLLFAVVTMLGTVACRNNPNPAEQDEDTFDNRFEGSRYNIQENDTLLQGADSLNDSIHHLNDTIR